MVSAACPNPFLAGRARNPVVGVEHMVEADVGQMDRESVLQDGADYVGCFEKRSNGRKVVAGWARALVKVQTEAHLA